MTHNDARKTGSPEDSRREEGTKFMGLPVATVGALFAGAVSISALHALIPSHWLSFAVVGRAQNWPAGRILALTALGGAGHMLATTALGLTLVLVGKTASAQLVIPEGVEHFAAAASLILLGIYFLISHRLGHKTCSHEHTDGAPPVEMAGAGGGSARGVVAQRAMMGTLVLGMTLSPCMDLLPLYLAAASLSWGLILALIAVMAVTTVGLMTGLVWLTLLGLNRWKLEWLEHHEGAAVGGILIALGVLLFVLGGLHTD
jgi:hypothetical protein